jgi:hypothetical protein
MPNRKQNLKSRPAALALEPSPQPAPLDLLARELEGWVRETVQELYRRALTETLRREQAAWELRMQRVWQETVRTRAFLENLTRLLSRRRELRKVLALAPAGLSRLSPDTTPFPEPVWSRSAGDAGSGLLARTPTGGAFTTRVRGAVAWLDGHPDASAAEAARRFRVPRHNLYRAAAYRNRLSLHPLSQERASRLDRALAYLATHRPRSIAEVAKAVRTYPSNLSQSYRFREAWDPYVKQQKLAGGAGAAAKTDPPPRRRRTVRKDAQP